MAQKFPEETLGHQMVLRVKHKFRQRIIEWIGSFGIMLLGFVLMHPAATFERSPYFVLMNQYMNEAEWAIVLFSVGFLRLVGLYINGSIEAVTPWIRSAGALIGFAVYSMISISVLYAILSIDYPPPMLIALTITGAISEVAAIFCAVVDARIYENGRRERSRNRATGS